MKKIIATAFAVTIFTSGSWATGLTEKIPASLDSTITRNLDGTVTAKSVYSRQDTNVVTVVTSNSSLDLKQEWKYDPNGNPLSNTITIRNNKAGEWPENPASIEEWHYDADMETGSTSWLLSESGRKGLVMTKHEYDTTKRITVSYSYQWDDSQNNWQNEPTFRSEYQYDEKRLKRVIKYYYGEETGEQLYHYDAKGRQTAMEHCNQSPHSNSFEQNWTNIQYDAAGRKKTVKTTELTYGIPEGPEEEDIKTTVTTYYYKKIKRRRPLKQKNISHNTQHSHNKNNQMKKIFILSAASTLFASPINALNINARPAEPLDSIVTRTLSGEVAAKTIYTYVSNNHIVETSYRMDYDTHALIPDAKWEYEYTQEGKLTKALEYEWNADKKDWPGNPSLKIEPIYDAQGRDSINVIAKWFDLQWDVIYKTEYQYDERQRLATLLCYYWNITTEEWDAPTSKTVFRYDDKGNQVRATEYERIAEHIDWVETYETEFQYNTAGRKTISKLCHEPELTNTFRFFSSIAYNYDRAGRITSDEAVHVDFELSPNVVDKEDYEIRLTKYYYKQ
ncbi:MAG: hypothetical protein LBH04_09225 [Tannerellaceae bacterium]|nr:hypothetical protein [Tannerellaceae bacterium]